MGTSNKTVFGYNGMNERISDAETSGGTTTTTYNRWCGSRICQSWNASALVKRYLDEGELNVPSGQKLIDMPDQLGSVRDVIDGSTGSLISSIDYAPYGGDTRSGGSTFTDYQYAGLLWHPQSALNLSATRAMDSGPGRWINRDPIGEKGGLNLYLYTRDDPTNRTDPIGKLDDTPGGGGSGNGSGRCHLAASWEMYRKNLYWLPGPIAIMYCVYDCNVSCPGSPNNYLTKLIPVWNPPYECPATL